MSSASGEEYFFKETALAQAKSLSQKVDEQPLLLPVSHIGEVGAVVGFFILLMAQEKLQHNGQLLNIIGHLSNDDALRGAFMLQNTLGKSHGK